MSHSPNTPTGADALVAMLKAYEVRHIFGLCGDTSLPFYDAMARDGAGIDHILTRDERHAGYMADAYARLTGKPGVCEGPSGGGATYILPGVVEANESSIPILAITTDVAQTSAGRYPLTELDQEALFRPLTKWNATFSDAARLPAMVRRAFREMTTGRPGAVHMALPFDVQKAPADAREIWADPRHTRFPALPASPDPAAIEDLARALTETSRALVICGGGPVIAGAEDALRQLAERLNVPVATTVSGQGAIAETHPQAIGVVGSNGGVPATRAIVDAADLILFIGCRAGSVTTERWRSPAPGQRIAHIDSDPAVIGANYDTEIAIAADARAALEALNAALDDRPAADHGGAALATKAWAAKLAAFRPLADATSGPVTPEATIAALARALPEDAVICADPGTPCPYVSAHYRWRRVRRHFITNRAHGALGYALAAAAGAQVARPDATVLALMGDGSFGFSCGEFETIVRLGLPIKALVFSNAVFGWIKAGQKSGFGARYHNVDFGVTDHAAVARAFGVASWTVDDPRALDATIAKALAHDGPALIDVISQPLHDAAAPVSEWVA
ncbi:thiamine pyrophosphate-binding protein [Ovoidimarina sediminis]|uniref:thiamine pyrophosphate-binding protein n=1 Tax=Ovoidimarina sediminis TaxID=3079856 RepID=UPI00291587F4|nr:thiamine pyrophosphate-binding protein [Rhodophyticola sp. MJ-SS7]MDU8942497.1 thiamine pyrophosphate-binding protein [Rhodophyticola sp. MJ-SS7]